MTKILIDRATAEQTLEALDSENPDIQLKAALALRTVLEQQQAKPVQEQRQARVDVITVNLMREGINKHRARELADHFVNFTLTPPLPVQEPVAWVAEVELNAAKRSNQEKFMVELWKKRLYASDIALYCIKESK